jgi:phosphate-selective porin OprO/OprP
MNFKLSNLVAATLAGSMLMGFGTSAMADSTDDILNALIAKGVLTEEEGALLMKGRTGEKEAAEAKKKTAVNGKFKDGFVFESGDGNFSFAPTARVHADYRNFDYNDGANNAAPASTTNSVANTTTVGADTFDIRRARLGFKAKYKEFYEAEVLADISSGTNTSATTTTWDVAYFNVAWWKQAQFRFGQFKMPMNLEELTSSNNIDFMERSFVNQNSPTKELGAMIHGTPIKGVTYALAYSNGAGKNAETDIREDSHDVIGRVTANFAEIMDNKDMVLHAGASFSQGDVAQGTVGVSGRTEARGATFFKAPTFGQVAASGAYQSIDRSRVGLEGVVAYNNFKIQSEWMNQNNDFTTRGDANALKRSYDLDTKTWYAEALWTITGEKYADIYKNGVFGGIKPMNDFDPTTFKGGAWELGLRYSKFDASDYNSNGIGNGSAFNDTAFGTTTGASATTNTKAAGFAEAKSYVAGIKFLPNSNTRFMLNYVKTDFDNAIGGATGGLVINNKRVNDERAIIMRAQWMF